MATTEAKTLDIPSINYGIFTNIDLVGTVNGLDIPSMEGGVFPAGASGGRNIIDSEISSDIVIRPTTTYFTKGTVSSLPTDNRSLEFYFEVQEYLDVATPDTSKAGVFSGLTENNFMITQFKFRFDNSINGLIVYWGGDSTIAPSDSTVYLQIFNIDTTSWETIDSDNSTSVDTSFVLEAEITEGVEDYYDSNNEVSCRVYQEVVL